MGIEASDENLKSIGRLTSCACLMLGGAASTETVRQTSGLLAPDSHQHSVALQLDDIEFRCNRQCGELPRDRHVSVLESIPAAGKTVSPMVHLRERDRCKQDDAALSRRSGV
jgi:hypothetical protein